MYDIIGDVHGHAEKLKKLLNELGYKTNREGTFFHPSRKVIFTGNFINKGPQIKETLEIIKGMTQAGFATTLLGYQEYSILCYCTKENGEYLHKHNNKNANQHLKTLREFNNGISEEWKSYLEWFMTLPFFFNLDGLRVVSACWYNKNLDFLKDEYGNTLTTELLRKSTDKKTFENKAIDETLKSKRAHLPEGVFIKDIYGNKKSSLRVKWWDKPQNKTYKEYAVSKYNDEVPEIEVSLKDMDEDLLEGYNELRKPLVVGYYNFDEPKFLNTNAICINSNISETSKLSAYSWFGENTLVAENIITV